MQKLETEIGRYSSKKLIEIIQIQANAHSEEYLDLVKNELIRRGELFVFDPNIIKLAESLSDNELKTLVEKERNDYNLEYVEVAIKEYLKRGFKNETGYTEEDIEVPSDLKIVPIERYPSLRIYSNIYAVFGILSFISIVLVFFFKGLNGYSAETKMYFTIIWITVYAMTGITLLASAEAIKVFLAIEENTRKP